MHHMQRRYDNSTAQVLEYTVGTPVVVCICYLNVCINTYTGTCFKEDDLLLEVILQDTHSVDSIEVLREAETPAGTPQQDPGMEFSLPCFPKVSFFLHPRHFNPWNHLSYRRHSKFSRDEAGR